jgi:iron(III) transport system ATP-binding protein
VSALEVRDLRVSFGATEVLRGVDLDVPGGTLTAVLGPSGCGKTTLLRVVAGFVRPGSGTVAVDGHVLSGPGTDVPPERRGIALVPQEGSLFPHLDVAGNVAFGLPRDQRRGSARVAEVLELVGLGGLARRRPDELSGGQQQRVALARALAPNPRLVLLDEPFSALDAGLRGSLRSDVRTALAATGATAVLVTHDQDEALSMADTVAVMDDGVVRMHASPEQVYTGPVDLGVARFVGQLVELPARLDGAVARTFLGDVSAVAAARPTASTADGVLALRPEQLRLHPAGAADGVPAVVETVAFHGHDATVGLLLEAAGGPARLLVRTTGPTATVGDHVRVTADGPGLFFADHA